MTSFKNIAFIALVALVAVTFVQQVQTAAVDQDDGDVERKANWTSCNITADPILSCQDCNTRLICKPIGGLLISCSNPYRPYCANGVCSPIPSAECA